MPDITLRLATQDSTIGEIELTPEQALDFAAGTGLAFYTVRDERILVDDDGTITVRDSAIPPALDDEAADPCRP